MDKKIKVGAVVYVPKVTVIWGIIADYFEEKGVPMECVFFKDYPLMVDAFLKGEIDIAWNSPLAWVDIQRATKDAINGPMRDTDRDRRSYIVVRNDRNINSISDLRGKTIGVGSRDSSCATLIPLYDIHINGVDKGEYTVKEFDDSFGLYGDMMQAELDSAKAVMSGEIDACCIIDVNYDAYISDGTLDKNQVKILHQTPPYDHCIFTGRPGMDRAWFDKWVETLFQMDYNNPKHKEMMDMEGLKKWVETRTSGFKQLVEACEYLDFYKN